MFRKILQSRIFSVLVILLAAFLGLKLISIQMPLSDLSKEAENVNQKIAEAQAKNQALAQQSQYLTSQAYLERQVRLRLNYKNPDEEAVQIYRLPVASKSVNEVSGSMFAKIWDWFREISK